jgi:exopolysaccharide biosynthesis predicted pyruvyltransferase EpsI
MKWRLVGNSLRIMKGSRDTRKPKTRKNKEEVPGVSWTKWITDFKQWYTRIWKWEKEYNGSSKGLSTLVNHVIIVTPGFHSHPFSRILGYPHLFYSSKKRHPAEDDVKNQRQESTWEVKENTKRIRSS